MPNLNIQTDSICAKLFVLLSLFFSYGLAFSHPLLFWFRETVTSNIFFLDLITMFSQRRNVVVFGNLRMFLRNVSSQFFKVIRRVWGVIIS